MILAPKANRVKEVHRATLVLKEKREKKEIRVNKDPKAFKALRVRTGKQAASVFQPPRLNSAKVFDFRFFGLKGEKGAQGEQGERGL